jgi:peptidoglycan biosynthesis protein MviN/MurJ (putative lipid II flippase)
MMYFKSMSDKNENITKPVAKKFRFSFLQVMGIVALVMIITALLSAWWVKHYIYASKFTPTVLTAKERKVLDFKLVKLEASTKKDLSISKKKEG